MIAFLNTNQTISLIKNESYPVYPLKPIHKSHLTTKHLAKLYKL